MKKFLKALCAVAVSVFVFFMLTSFGAQTGQKQEPSGTVQPDRSEYNAQLQRLDELRREAEAAEAEVQKKYYIAAVNAAFDGEPFAPADGEEHTAQAILPDGMLVDYWLLNGERVEGGESFTLSATENTTLEPVLRKEKKLVAVNSFMYLLDENGRQTGEPFTELSFEDRESVSVIIMTDTDMLTTVDHWIVNSVAIDGYEHCLHIYAKNITEPMTFEPIFAACYLRHDVPIEVQWKLFETVPLAYEGERP